MLLSPSLNSDILAHYFPPLEPHPWGLHLQQAWNMRRDMFLFWPWYRAELAAARPLGIPDPAFLHDWTVGLLQSGASYHRSYRAAFEYDTPDRLPLLACRSLVGRVPGGGVGAVGKSPAEATAESLAQAGDLSTAVVTAAVLGRVGLRAQL